jgi:hypothetical protein
VFADYAITNLRVVVFVVGRRLICHSNPCCGGLRTLLSWSWVCRKSEPGARLSLLKTSSDDSRQAVGDQIDSDRDSQLEGPHQLVHSEHMGQRATMTRRIRRCAADRVSAGANGMNRELPRPTFAMVVQAAERRCASSIGDFDARHTHTRDHRRVSLRVIVHVHSSCARGNRRRCH